MRRIERARRLRPHSYRSEARWSLGEGEWELEFSAPDRFRLRHLDDEWLELGRRRYSFAGFWTETTAAPDVAARAADVRRSLQLERWQELLEAEPDDVRTSAGLLELRYGRAASILWLDDDDRIVRAESMFLEQTFSYDDSVEIRPPDVLATLDANGNAAIDLDGTAAALLD